MLAATCVQPRLRRAGPGAVSLGTLSESVRIGANGLNLTLLGSVAAQQSLSVGGPVAAGGTLSAAAAVTASSASSGATQTGSLEVETHLQLTEVLSCSTGVLSGAVTLPAANATSTNIDNVVIQRSITLGEGRAGIVRAGLLDSGSINTSLLTTQTLQVNAAATLRGPLTSSNALTSSALTVSRAVSTRDVVAGHSELGVALTKH